MKGVNKYDNPPDSSNSLWYDPSINRFEDECGKIIHDLSQYFDTWQLDKWKKTKDYGRIVDKTGGLWELFYNNNGVYGRCYHLCLACLSKCEIYDLIKDWEREEIEWMIK